MKLKNNFSNIYCSSNSREGASGPGPHHAVLPGEGGGLGHVQDREPSQEPSTACSKKVQHSWEGTADNFGNTWLTVRGRSAGSGVATDSPASQQLATPTVGKENDFLERTSGI